MRKMKKLLWIRKPVNLFTVIVLAVSTFFPVIEYGVAHAYGLVTTRTIGISSASNAASNATTTYSPSFNVATTGVVAGMVVDFCSNDPIIGDTCTAPTGFTVGGSPTIGTVTTTGQTGLTWSAASANSGRTLELTTTGSATGSVASGANVNFTVLNVQNPTTLGTYYARIFTFATTGGPAAWVTASATGNSTTGAIDAGGIALSTAQSITITAKVQEQLTFCVYILGSCGAGGSSVTLGNTQGVLSTTGPYVDRNTDYSVQTNASGGAVVYLKGTTLTSGSNTIAAMGASAIASTAGTSQFGLCSFQTSGSTITIDAPYNNVNCSTTTQTAGTGSTGGVGAPVANFALDTNAVNGTTSTFGDNLANVVAGSAAVGVIAFVGNISTTQIAGIYTTTFMIACTGTY
jgi:hypothetical protein